jgi:methylthioribose-1-phosphate isomerase
MKSLHARRRRLTEMRAVDWEHGKVRFIDQTMLPHEEVSVVTDDVQVVAEAIRTLRIRGAPAIGIAAAFAAVLPLASMPPSSTDWETDVQNAIALLSETRPTAVNLFASLARLRTAADSVAGKDARAALDRLLAEALAIQDEDSQACARIGELGSALLPTGATVLTHCNTGMLATGGDGTALAIITAAARQGKIAHVYVDETRPLFQGARLTSWELLRAGISASLITDSTAGMVMKSSGLAAVIVGADRIAANGDVANKIGTYALAVLAFYHKIPFYVAAPTSTIDRDMRSGENIPIEVRDPTDVTRVGTVQIAPEGMPVYAPAFDVTPARLISAIITERGVLRAPYEPSIQKTRPEKTYSGAS